jgi:two-component system, NtrC family, nitrogen regulation sensor histidine kinase NtrY
VPGGPRTCYSRREPLPRASVTLAARLLLAFGLVAIFATALVGASVREASREIIERGFEDRIEAAASGVSQELHWEAEGLKGLLAPLCEHDTFVDKAQLELDRVKGDVKALEPGRWIAFRHFVPEQASALRLDDLVLVTDGGTILGAVDAARVGIRDARLAALLKLPPGSPHLRPVDAPAAGAAGVTAVAATAAGEPTMEVHCVRAGSGAAIGLVGTRKIDAILERVGAAYRVKLIVVAPGARAPASDVDALIRPLSSPVVAGLDVVASAPRGELTRALAKLDRSIAVTGATVLALAIVIAIVLAGSLSRPIVALARETREVVSGAPRKVRGRGGREIATLADAFNRTIDELTAMRRRLAVSERIAARREVARHIAHEIKNPLAPIRAAVETLRRLRLREDPAFDEYFEEATTTVLGEVHRIANIVTEFTRFARLPAPNPEPIDLAEVARRVVNLHASSLDGAGPPCVELRAEPIPTVLADRDQMVQVLTNLVQNGLDAACSVRPDARVVVSLGPVTEGVARGLSGAARPSRGSEAPPPGRVRLVIRDNGPGVSQEMQARLFEPYATTKEKGTGLGLAIVQRIVFEHGGEITYRTAIKGGAVFEVTLPVAGPPLLERPPVRGGDRAAPGG